MNLQQLEYATALEKAGSFTQAAKALHVTQPALSLQIKNLENEIGISLFDRSKSRIAATEQGVKFLLKAGEILMASKQLKEYAMTLGGETKGKLRIGIIPTLSPFLVPLFVNSLITEHSDFTLEVHELLTEQVLEQIRLGELDGGIISTPVARQSIKVEPLFYESFYLYQHDKTSLKGPLSVSNIEIGNLWLLEEGNCFRDQVNDICSFRSGKTSKNQFQYHCNSIDSLIRMVDHYGGSTILPELTTLSLDAEQEQKLVPIDLKVREVGFVTRKMTGKEYLFDILSDYIQRSIPSRMIQLNGREVVDPGIDNSW